VRAAREFNGSKQFAIARASLSVPSVRERDAIACPLAPSDLVPSETPALRRAKNHAATCKHDRSNPNVRNSTPGPVEGAGCARPGLVAGVP